MRRLLSGCVLVGLLLIGTPGSAQPTALQWTAPAECPARSEVADKVAVWLGQAADELELGPVEARATVRREEEQWVLSLHLASPTGASNETLTAERCEALADLVALKISLLVQPIATARTATRAKAVPVVAVAEKPAAEKPAAERPVEAERLRFSLRAVAGLGVGQLPKETPSAGLYGSARWAWLRFELGASYWFRRTAEFGEMPGVGAQLDLLTGVARICPMASLGSIEVPLCVGLEGGVVRAEGFGATLNRTAYEPWVAVIIGPALVLPLHEGWHFWIETDAVVGLLRPGFSVRNIGPLYRADRGSAQVWAGVEYQFR